MGFKKFIKILYEKYYGEKPEIILELDANDDLTSFEINGRVFRAKIKKAISKKMLERLQHNTTGIIQIGTVYPTPYDREELINKEFAENCWYRKPVFSFLITIAVIIIDILCYLLMFQSFVLEDQDYNIQSIMSAVGAAVAIDVLPLFFAHCLHRVNISRKKVIKIFSIISIIDVVAFLVLALLIRLGTGPFKGESGIAVGWAWILFMIPISTSLVCFIVNYLSYTPLKAELKKLRLLQLYKQEDINELQAAIAEYEAQEKYTENLIAEDEVLYNSAYDLVDTVGEYYRTSVRTKIIPLLKSPADTTDLSADRGISPTKKVPLPLILVKNGKIIAVNEINKDKKTKDDYVTVTEYE